MILIVGLGNPGTKYGGTFHNVGFMAVDALKERLKVKWNIKREGDSRVAKGELDGVKFVLAKPETYMNLSGTAVKKLVAAYGVDETRELLVCYDDVDLPVGKLRLREEGSAGTHNGMRNIVAELNTTQFARLRIGTATEQLKDGEVALIDFVLSKIPYELKPTLDGALSSAADAMIQFIKGEEIARIQEKLNRK